MRFTLDNLKKTALIVLRVGFFMYQSSKKSIIFSLFIFFSLLTILPIIVYQVQKPQEIRVKAQTSNCQTLSYPCQEGLISFPNDEGKHLDKQVEWWYLNLNSTSASNGFSLAGAVALVRVKQSDGTDKGFALLEMTIKSPGQSFFYKIPTGTITSSTGSQNVSFIASPGQDISTIKFYQTGNPFEYKLEVAGTDLNINLTLKSNKRPLVEGGNGFVPIFPQFPTDTNYYSFYYSLTNISFTDGSITLPNLNPFTASGIAWVDHQWFNSPFAPSFITDPYSVRGNHEWFSIQLDNNVQIVAWNIFKDPVNSTFVLKNLDVIDTSGIQTHYEDVIIDVPRSWEYWIAPDGKVLADTWRIFKDGVFNLEIYTSVVDQYVREAGTYEGTAGVRGTYKGNSIEGVGFAEMTLGYPTRPIEPISEVCGDAIDNDLDYRIDEFCPDLLISSLSTTTTVMYPGGNISVPHSLTNQGAGSAGSSTIAFHLSTDAVYGGTDDIAFTNTRTVYSLAAGATSSVTTWTMAVPSTTPLGTYYICAMADNGQTVPEENETNNSRCTTSTIKVALPDILVTALSGPASAVTGTSISLSTTIVNQGEGPSKSVNIGYYLSTDATITTSDTRISTLGLGSGLAPGATKTTTISGNVFSTLAAGTYYLGAIADYNSQVKESNETNNTFLGKTISVTIGADLVILSHSGPTSATRGTVISTTTVIKNQGTGSSSSSTIGFYLSTDSVITTSDTRIGTHSLSGFAAGQQQTITKTLTVPSTLTPITYYLGAIADYSNQARENNETNNSFTGSTIIINP